MLTKIDIDDLRQVVEEVLDKYGHYLKSDPENARRLVSLDYADVVPCSAAYDSLEDECFLLRKDVSNLRDELIQANEAVVSLEKRLAETTTNARQLESDVHDLQNSLALSNGAWERAESALKTAQMRILQLEADQRCKAAEMQILRFENRFRQ